MFEYFEGNYPWNLALNMCLNLGGNIAEIDSAFKAAGQSDGPGDSASSDLFLDTFVALGEAVSVHARADLEAGNRLGAGRKFLHASNYFMTGERNAHWDHPDKSEIYRKMLESFKRGVELQGLPIEFVKVPYEDTYLPALFIRGGGDGPRPCMIHFDGLDVMKELLFLTGIGDGFKQRGISTLIVDHPGVGEALRLLDLKGIPDTERPAAACVDYLEGRSDVDRDRIGMIALSLGGYYATRSAAFEPRLKCCVAWGAIWDWNERVKLRLNGAGGEKSVSNFFEHVNFVFGTNSPEEVVEFSKHLMLEKFVERIECPILITHGENDRQVPLDQARRAYEGAVNARVRDLKVFTADTGGAEHCSADNFDVNTDYVAHWVQNNL